LARPGNVLPVVGVWPWRTSNTSVGAGALGTVAQPTVEVVPSLHDVEADVVVCRACPRLVEWRELVGVEKVARFREWELTGHGRCLVSVTRTRAC